MTNDQATLLAEKVWPEDNPILIWRNDRKPNYTIYLATVKRIGTKYQGDSWESAFLAAGVEILDNVNGGGVLLPNEDGPIRYRLLEPGVGR